MEPRDNQSNPRWEGVTRRLFFGAAAGATSVLAADEEAAAQDASGLAKRTRQLTALAWMTAQLERDAFQPKQTPNGDEDKFANRSEITPRACRTMARRSGSERVRDLPQE